MPHQSVFRRILGVLPVCGVLFAAQPASSQVIYVDDTAFGADNGSSWCDAYNRLQDALRAASESGGAITEIRLAGGIYKPDQGGQQTSGDRTATFQLVRGLALTGGYAGCRAHNPGERDIVAYQTTLSGDLDGNDVGDRFDPSRYENSYHIVTGSGTDAPARLDGLTITAGRADGGDPYDDGAGMYNDNGSPTVVDCMFAGNWASNHGGGMYNTGSSSPTLTNCIFHSNSADDFGGGVSNDDISSPALTGCTFVQNTAGDYGGGVSNGGSSAAVLMNCSFIQNSVYYNGGGMCNTDQSAPTVTNCIFVQNSSRSGSGGGMFNAMTDALVMTNCALVDNKAIYGGAGIYNQGANPAVTNCILWGNSNNGSTNESAQVYNASGATPDINYCCVEGWTGSLGGVENTGDDPLFVPGPAGCYYLSWTAAGQPADSPCIDSGSATAASLDLDTLTTQSDEGVDTGTVDIGYHYPVTGRPLIMGDFDRSGDVGLMDFAHWADCMTGPHSAGVSPCCRIFDFEHDHDADLNDLAAFQRAFNVP